MSERIAVQVTHNEAARRFEATVDGRLARCDYRRVGNILQIHHTEVPVELEGRGIAAQLVAPTLAWARAQGLAVAPYCSYVRSYMKRHPETSDLLAPGMAL
jgi:predicted GNAT family acetyltransferase